MELKKLPEPFNPKGKPNAVNPTAADLRGQEPPLPSTADRRTPKRRR
jgi:hypothetical protein